MLGKRGSQSPGTGPCSSPQKGGWVHFDVLRQKLYSKSCIIVARSFVFITKDNSWGSLLCASQTLSPPLIREKRAEVKASSMDRWGKRSCFSCLIRTHSFLSIFFFCSLSDLSFFGGRGGILGGFILVFCGF